jgi:hypothetical protein
MSLLILSLVFANAPTDASIEDQIIGHNVYISYIHMGEEHMSVLAAAAADKSRERLTYKVDPSAVVFFGKSNISVPFKDVFSHLQGAEVRICGKPRIKIIFVTSLPLRRDN